MKFFEKRDRRGVACNPEQATGLLTGGAGTLFDKTLCFSHLHYFSRNLKELYH